MTILIDNYNLNSLAEKMAGESAAVGSPSVQGQAVLPGPTQRAEEVGPSHRPAPGRDGGTQTMILEANSPVRCDAAPAEARPMVLVVDDEPLICDVLRRYLEIQGFRVLVAESG